MLSTTETSNQLLQSLVHDLRQPLSTIENSAYYLNLLAGVENPQVQEQILCIQAQVERAANILSQLAAELK